MGQGISEENVYWLCIMLGGREIKERERGEVDERWRE
jgi:hypothetical protein